MTSTNTTNTTNTNNNNNPNMEEEIDHEAIIRRQSIIRSSSLTASSLLTPETPQAQRNILLRLAPIYKIVLTGGPCGGKTTALARLSSYLRERGFEVFTVPEAFTILAGNGFGMDYFGVEGMPTVVQGTVMDVQMSLEDSFERVLRAKGRPGVILCDRGLMDGSAYMEGEEWDRFLESRDLTSAEIREGRYNAVFHLVTAAEGAERFYSLENNAARTETPEEARDLDLSTRKAWVGHPNLMIIDNTTDFEGKLNKLVSATSKLVGLPTTVKDSTVKLLLKTIPDLAAFPPDVKYNIFEVEKVYLYDDQQTSDMNYVEEYSFVRKRSHIHPRTNQPLGTTYGLTTVKITPDGKQVEVKRIISKREYNSACKARDTTRHVVIQRRVSFLYKMQSFNIHIYREPEEDLCIVHAQTASAELKTSSGSEDDGDGECDNGDHSNTKEEEKGNDSNHSTGGNGSGVSIDIPSFLDVERRLENTKEDNEKYGAFSISLKR